MFEIFCELFLGAMQAIGCGGCVIIFTGGKERMPVVWIGYQGDRDMLHCCFLRESPCSAYHAAIKVNILSAREDQHRDFYTSDESRYVVL